MTNTKRVAIALVLIGSFCANFALTQTAPTTPAPVEWSEKAKVTVRKQLGGLYRHYKPTKDQIPKLKAVLLLQYKDLMDHDKVRNPKIKAMNEEIAVLRKQIGAIEKRKAVYAKSRAELLLDHKAELSNVFTVEQKLAKLSSYISTRAIAPHYAKVLPEAAKADLKKRCDDAAAELTQANKANDSAAVRDACKTIAADTAKLVTPEIRQASVADFYYTSTMRMLAMIKFTDNQLALIREKCAKLARLKADLSGRYAQNAKEREVLGQSLARMGSSEVYRKIRDDVVETVLTDEQLESGKLKRK
ncbi:MAG: hypothetical protein HN350_19330 [Phycisphaerales bacterium]|nr:hypothetical protein [Phycisphaerales bacterium]